MKSFRYGDVKQLQYSGMQKGLGANLSILALDNLYCSGDFSTYKTENEKKDIKYKGTLNNIEVNCDLSSLLPLLSDILLILLFH